MPGKGERADVGYDLVQAVDQQQEEIGDPRHRAGDVAKRDDLRLVAVPSFPGGEEGHAAPCGVAPEGPAHVEMAAPLALARLAVALAQPARDLADQMPHLLDLPRFDPRQWRVAQDFVAEVFGFLAPVEQQRLRNRLANGFAQRLERSRQPFRQRGIGRGQLVEIVAKARIPIWSRMRPENIPRWVK